MGEDLTSRVARLEARMDGIDGLSVKVDAIHDELTRYRGALGMLTLLISCIVAAGHIGKDWFLSHWK